MGKITLLEIVLTGIPDAPTITNTNADSGLPLNGGDFELIVTGANYVANTKLLINGVVIETTYNSSTSLTGIIPGELMTVAEAELQLKAINPWPSGSSDVYVLTVSQNIVLVAITDDGYDSGKYAARSTDGGETWISSPLPAPMEDVTYDTTRSRFLAVGENYCYYSDDDGESWTQSKIEPSASRLWRSICHDPVLDRVVIVCAEGGAAARAAYSDDGGETWTLATTIPSQTWQRCVVAPWGGFYAGCSGSGSVANKIAYSADGDSWAYDTGSSNITVSEMAASASAVFGGNRSTGNGQLNTGSGWAANSAALLPGFQALTHGGGNFIGACTASGGAIGYDADGAGGWTTSITGVGTLECLAYSAGLGRAFGGGSSGAIGYTDDLLTWEAATPPSGSSGVTWDAIASNG